MSLAVLFAASSIANCSSSPPPRVDMRALPAGSEARIANGEAVYLRYLGTGGILIRWGDRTILTAPYFSGYNLREIVTSSSVCAFASPLTPDYDRIHQNADPFSASQAVADDLPDQLLKAEAIFVGHAHYDHLLDVPQIVRCYAPGARVYGSTAAVSMLNQVAMDIRTQGRPACAVRRGASPPVAVNGPASEFLLRFADVERDATGTVGAANPGSEFEIRYRAVAYEHAPHIPHVDALRLCKNAFQLGMTHSPPKSACDWIEGQTFAYYFDFLRNDELQFRIYYNDAAGGKAYAKLPPGIAPGSIDLAVLTAASFEFVDDYPEEFLRVARPDAVFMNHWENFFQFNQVRKASAAPAGPPGPVLFTDLQEFHNLVLETLPVGGRAPEDVLLIPDIGAEFLLDVQNEDTVR